MSNCDARRTSGRKRAIPLRYSPTSKINEDPMLKIKCRRIGKNRFIPITAETVKLESEGHSQQVLPDRIASLSSSDPLIIKKEENVRSNTNSQPLKKKKTQQRKKVKAKPTNTHNMQRPTAAECHFATAALAALHPHVVEANDDRRKTLLESCGMRDSVTDAIVSTMLSQNTTDANSKAAYASLKKTLKGNGDDIWAAVEACDNIEKIENAIRVAGLAKTRSERIHSLLRTVKEERGSISMEYLRDMTDEEIKAELGRFKGLGPKTISCVLLFALGRPEFPVDTHVLRITQKMGWVWSDATRESAYEHLNRMVPAEVKLDLHCLLVTHGKQCHRCAANGRPQFPPKDGSKIKCPLFDYSPSLKMMASSGDDKENANIKLPGSSVMVKNEYGRLDVRIKQNIKSEKQGLGSTDAANIKIEPDLVLSTKIHIKEEEIIKSETFSVPLTSVNIKKEEH
mmetsp:Transcript_46267/g.69796  ORF Transcript_46267/g.69796 Transcript_46267/m.69796 type:complete len:455 (-) Transcript_46267:55-1419(-)